MKNVFLNTSAKNIKEMIKRMEEDAANVLAYIVSSRGASQLRGSLLGIPLGYKAN